MRYLAFALTLAASLHAPLPASRPALNDKPVRVEGGLVSGAPGKDASIIVFKGIPFAAPPVGDLRWREPKPVVPWQGTRKATEFGASCMQNIVDVLPPWTHEFMTHTAVSEDCLFLNVWTPAKAAGEKRPVYVYIYGGANTSGSGAVPIYDGEGLAKKGIVAVTMNYRVGIFGFFTHPELSAESEHHVSGNYALLDLIAGLKWVHNNIAAFGGDPGRVVIGGQSAGSWNVHSLIASPLAKGLFHAAIAQSGSSVSQSSRTLAEQEQAGVKFAESKGAHSLADLRKMSYQDLATRSAGATGVAQVRFPAATVVDGYVQPAFPAFVSDVPTLTGSNKDESGASPHPSITEEAYARQAQRYGPMAADYVRLYPLAASNEGARDAARMSTYVWAVNRAKVAKTKVFTYYWDHTLPGPESDKYGAFHSSEIGYVMNTLDTADRPFTAEDRKIAEMMSNYWANFIRTGDPNGPGLPKWPSVQEQPGMTMELGDNTAVIPAAADPAKVAFFQKAFSQF